MLPKEPSVSAGKKKDVAASCMFIIYTHIFIYIFVQFEVMMVMLKLV